MAGLIPTEEGKIFAFKKGTTWGVPAGASGAQVLRRASGMFMPEKDTFQSDEVEPNFQVTGFRHGQRRSKGNISGRLSCGTFATLMASALRQGWQTAPTTGALTNVTAAVTVAPAGTFTRAAGSFITDGFRVGQFVIWTGWATTGTPNNSRLLLITALTATVMTGIFLDGTAVAAKSSGDSVTCVLAGKQTWIPQSGHVFDFYDFEEYQPDMAVTQSELAVSQVMTSLGITFDPKGYTNVDMAFVGKTMQFATGSPYFTSPTAVTSSGLHGGIDGRMYVGGSLVADVTAMNLNLALGNALTEPTFGQQEAVDFIPDKIVVSGSITVLFRDGVLRDGFWNEANTSILAQTRAGRGALSDTFGLVLPQLSLTSADKGNSGRAVTRTYNFTAINNKTGTGADQTSIAIQDTLAP